MKKYVLIALALMSLGMVLVSCDEPINDRIVYYDAPAHK